MNITQESRGGWCIVALTGRADASNADDLGTALTSAAQSNAKVALDLSGLEYISSAGLRSVLEGARAAQEQKGEFVICAPQAGVKNVLDICGMQHILRIEESLPC